MDGRGPRSSIRATSRWLRRLAVVGLLAMAVGVAVPPGTLPPGGSFPTGWVSTLLATRVAWALPGPAPSEPGPAFVPEDLVAVQRAPKNEAGRPAADPWTAPDLNRSDRYDPATSVRVPERSTETSTTYRNADGSYSVVASTRPVNVKAADGSWHAIDTTLVAGADGRLHAATSPVAVSVATRGTASRARTDSLASVTLPGGQSVAFGLQGAARVDATVAGAATTYEKILPSTDLRLEATSSGLKESIVLAAPGIQNSWVFPLTLDGLTPRLTKQGSVDLVDAKGAVAAVIPPGFMQDSRFDRERGDFTTSQNVRYELITSDGGPALRLTADRAWLDDPTRVYPVIIDPSIDSFYAQDDVFVDNDYTGPAEQNGVDLTVGTYDGAHIARSFLDFGHFNAALAGHRIIAARLFLYLSWSYDCNTVWGVNVYRVTTPWTVGDLAYAGLWGPNVDGLPPIGAVTQDDNYPACTNTGANRSIGDWAVGWLDPATFNDWSLNPASNMGLGLVGQENGWGERFGWKRYTSRNYGDGSLGPQMIFDYFDTAPQVNTQHPPAGATVTSLTPELSADATDPDTFPNKGVTYKFIVTDPETTNQVAESNETSASTYVVPTGALQWGKTYVWTVIASDTISASNAAETSRAFTTSPPQPLVTSGLAQNGGQGFAQDGRNYTTEATDLVVPTIGPKLEVKRSYNSLDPRVGNAFGAGWSSIVDARATEQTDAAGVVRTIAVTYPSGQEVAFGRNPDNSFSPPGGRFSTLAVAGGGGYTLTDKDGTTYTFGNATGVTGQFALSTVADASARALSVGLTAGQVTSLTSASGRALTLTWYTPAGATKAHVRTVSTPAAVPGNPASVSIYTYDHTGDLLTKVCPPTSTTACHTYTYGTSTAYPPTVQNLGPRSYWRLGDAAGTVAVSAVADNGGVDNGTYVGSPTLGQTGPLAGSTAKAVTFGGGSTTAVTLPKTALVTNKNMSVSLWFKTTTAGPLLGESNQPFGSATQPWSTAPPLYVGTDGKLRGVFPTAPVAQTVVGLAGKCLDNMYGGNANGNAIVLYDCNGGGTSQLWERHPDGSLRIAGKCLDAAGYGVANGTLLQLYACHGGANQVFEFVNGALRNPVSGRCVDVPFGNTANGAVQLYLWDCNGGANQQWSSPLTPPITSSGTVTDGNWHHAVLTAAGNTQQLYLDGVSVGTRAGEIKHGLSAYAAIGGGYASGAWPSQQSPAGWKSFNGSIAEVSLWERTLTDTEVGVLRPAGISASRPLASALRPTGRTSASVEYDNAAGTVKQVTDANGGVWQLAAPTVGGSYQVHASAVLGAGPSDYWRLADKFVVNAVNQVTNQVNGGVATYSGVTLGVTPGENWRLFDGTEATVASFNGTSNYLKLPAADVPKNTALSIGMWFRLAPGQSGVLFGYQQNALPAVSTGWVPALYVGTDGKLRGEIYLVGVNPLASANTVTDNAWHHVVLAAGTGSQDLYLDGLKIGTLAGALSDFSAAHAQVGAGQWTSWPAAGAGTFGYWPGQIAEVSYYRKQLTQGQVSLQYAARQNATGGLARTVVVTDPANHAVSYQHDMLGRKIAEVDALGFKTQYGYGEKGYLHTVTDPNGNVTTAEQDVRGNTTSSTTCQTFPTNCSTVWFTYFPDATTVKLTSNAKNDVMLTMRDGRSTSDTDNAYLTSFGYDTAGNRTTVTDPLGRVTTTTYTTTGTPAYGGGTTKTGLPWTVTTPGGATQTAEYYPNGDLARMTDPAGKVTAYTYDGLGRVAGQTETTSAFPSGLTTTTSYDPLGQVTQQNAVAVTNRVTGAVHTAVTTHQYNNDGQPLSQTVTDSTGGDAPRTVSWEYNAYGQQVKGYDPAGKATTLVYDAFGRIVKETDALGKVVRSEYDHKGHLVRTVLEGYTGNPNNPTGPADQELSKRWYDAGGRLTKVADATGETMYAYTHNDLVKTVTRQAGSSGPSFQQIENTYDRAGNVTATTTNNGQTVTTYTVDAAGRTTSSTVDAGNGDLRTTTQTLSPDNFPVTTTQSDGSTVLSTTDTLYDPLGRPLASSRANTTALAPVAWFPLNETSGTTAADASGNSPGTATATATWSTDRSGSIALTGSLSEVATAGPVVDTTRSFTIAAWVKLSSTATGNRTAVTQDGTRRGAFDLQSVGSSGKWRVRMCPANNDGATCTSATSTVSSSFELWTHLVGVYDSAAGRLKLYVDGSLQADVAQTEAWPAAVGPLAIGRGKGDGTATDRWPGGVDDVQVYQKALSATEVTSVKNGSAPAAGAGVVRTSWTRDQSGLVTAQTDPAGRTTDYSLDEAGRTAVVTAPAVLTEVGGGTPLLTRPVSYTGFNTFGEAVESKNPNGRVTLAGYDAVGRPVLTRMPNYTPPGSSTPIVADTTRTYDDIGRLATVTDPLNNTTAYTYDQLGRVVKVAAPNGGNTRYTYNLVGDRLSATDPTGATTSAEYDYLGRQTKTVQVVRQTSQNLETVYGYSTGGWLATIQSPAGVTVTTTYNKVGQPLTVNDGVGTTTFTYDRLGRQTRTTLPDNTYTTLTYNPVGWITGESSYNASNVLRKSRTSTYDTAGRMVSATDARGHTSTFSYDATGLLTAQTQPVNSTPADAITTTFGYDPAGAPTRFTDGRGNAFLTTYNSWGRPESEIEPATAAHPNAADRTFTTTYDANGRVAARTSPGGVVVSNAYDAMGQLTVQSGTGAEVATTNRTFDYDLAGRPTDVSGPGGGNEFTYDDRGLLLTATGGSGSATFAYNADGAMTSRVDAAGTTTYGYDAYGRLQSVGNSGTGVAAAFTYNTLNLPTKITYGSDNNARHLGYDDSHRLTNDELKTSGGTSIARIQYEWDANDNETKKTTTSFNGGTVVNDYTYDRANRLTSWDNHVTPVVYAYDKSGNRVQAGTNVFTYDERNRLKTSGGGTVVYGYTPRGTLSATTNTGVSTLVTKADSFGQILYQDTSPTAHRDYTYDGLGRLVRSGASFTGVGNDLATDGTLAYTRDPGGGVVGEADGATKRLVWTDRHTDVVGQFTATGTTMSGSATYDPLGKVLAATGMVGNLGFQSEYTDLSTGRVNMAARWYNTATGQFDTRDSVGLSPTPASVRANRYGYADVNPLTVTDPTGHGGLFSAISNAASNVVKAATTVVTAVARTVTNAASSALTWVNDRIDDVKHFVSNAWNAAKNLVSAAINYVGNAVNAVGQWVAEKANQVVQAAKAVVVDVVQRAAAVVENTQRLVSQTMHTVADAVNSAKQWVVEHKDLLIEIAAIGAAVLAGLACTALTAGVGALACLAGTAALINLAKDAAQGNIHSIGDAFKSAGTGAFQGALSVFGGALGGRVAAAALSKLGGFAAGVAGRALGGAIAGGAEDAAMQLATTGEVDLLGVGMAAGTGAVFGAAGGRGRGGHGGGSGRGGGDSPSGRGGGADAPPRRGSDPGCDGHSFAPGTRVLMADGSTKPISDITVGDKVAATDPETGRTEGKPVTALHLNRDKDLTTVALAVAGSVAVLSTTDHHPFWDAAAKKWTDAADLSPGESATTSPDGQTQTVLEVKSHAGNALMRDLTVADIHTYYVIAGDTPVLVHNCGETAGTGEDTVSLFKASQRGLGEEHNANGYTAENFPGNGAYFAREKAIAESYATHYGEGVIETRIPRSVYEEHFAEHEMPYLGAPPGTELAIPPGKLDLLSQFERIWHR